MRREFQVNKLSDIGMANVKDLANYFNDLLDYIESIVKTNNRELVICREKLEEACFYAKKAMAVEDQKE